MRQRGRTGHMTGAIHHTDVLRHPALHLRLLLLLAHLHLHLLGHPSRHSGTHPTHLRRPIDRHIPAHHTWLHPLHVRAAGAHGLGLYASEGLLDWGHYGAARVGRHVGHLGLEAGHM